MKKAVFGLIANEGEANRVVEVLLASGFSNEDVSILCPHHGSHAGAQAQGDYGTPYAGKNLKGHLSTEKHTKAPEGGVTGTVVGGILGGSLGLLAGIGALAIPGLGPFIAAGPIMATLSGTALGGSLGLVVGALIGAGIPEYEARRYEAGLQAGNTLISVHADTEERLSQAKDILKREGVKDISCTREKAQV